MQLQTVSKSEFKAKALEYLRLVELKRQPLTITHAGKPVVKVVPAHEKSDEDILKALRGSVLKYEFPFEPAVPLEDWEVLK